MVHLVCGDELSEDESPWQQLAPSQEATVFLLPFNIPVDKEESKNRRLRDDRIVGFSKLKSNYIQGRIGEFAAYS